MSNPDHLEIVKLGASGIAEWRKGLTDDVVLDLSGADLQGMRLHGADLTKASFRGANLKKANIFKCEAPFADFAGASLCRASLALSTLPSANFTGADLTNADLTSTDLTVACFKDANLTGARLTRTVFERNEMSGACFTEALTDGTFFLNLDLSDVHDLDQVTRYAPSTIGIDTLYKSKGKIPDEFLRRCGVSNTLVAYVHSLVGNPIEFFSCFISYSEPDDAFSKRVYNDLQAEGVRCWRWRGDAKWGRTLMKEVDQSIRLYDKLIVVLSEHSLQAEPVIREIERALQKETREAKEVLFPIRIDDSVFSWPHELQADVLRKVIGDFRNWTDPRTYDASFKRLIVGLQRAARAG
jgi:uncharacterized protein YjbI with pentapeptide repeats